VTEKFGPLSDLSSCLTTICLFGGDWGIELSIFARQIQFFKHENDAINGHSSSYYD
jgi:hypothetical protein